MQGIAALDRGIFVADHAAGIFHVDPRTRQVTPLAVPSSATLVGVDALVASRAGDLIAIQNGVRPNRVLRIQLDAGGKTATEINVLESGHLVMAEPALACTVGDELEFIGNAGWSRFEQPSPRPTAPRPVPILRTKLPPPPEQK